MRPEFLRTAEKIAAQCSTRRTPPTWTHEFAVSYILSMVELAIEDEREACAKLADEYTKASYLGAVGAAIRARGYHE
jgi:hypothetical protein